MKTQKQIPTRNPIEYHLSVGWAHDENRRKETLIVILTTAKDFRNFLYKLVVKDSIEGDTLRLSIEGLRAPQPSLPGFGPAEWRKSFESLPEHLRIVVAKLGGAENEFLITLSRDRMDVHAKPDAPFVDLVPGPEKI